VAIFNDTPCHAGRRRRHVFSLFKRSVQRYQTRHPFYRSTVAFLDTCHLSDQIYYLAYEPIKNPHFAFEIFTEYGTKVTSFNTWVSGFDILSLPPGKGFIELQVDSLALFTGRYFITLWSASAGNIWYDRLDQCAVLNVEPSDFFKTGRLMKKQHYGIAIFPCAWQVNVQADSS
jgi:hypothetical protein